MADIFDQVDNPDNVSNNISQMQVTPLKPKILANERIYVYVPKASIHHAGIASYSDTDFSVINGKVSLVWNIPQMNEDIQIAMNNSLNALSNSEDALETAITAESIASNIDAKATDALSNSEDALETAIAAESIATGIDAKATEALSNSEIALSNSETALSNSETALSILSFKADLVDGKVPANQLPSYMDDVIEVDTFGDLPIIGESGKIYVTTDTNLTYRWSGTHYTEISQSLALGETSATAYRGDRGKVAYDHSQIINGANPHNTTFANIASKPITIEGYGISDAYTKTETNDLLDTKELLLPIMPSEQELKYLGWDGVGNKIWKPIPSGAGTSQAPIYFTNEESSIVVGYKKLTNSPSSEETIISTLLTNEEKLINTYLFELEAGIEVVDSGTWLETMRSYVSNASGHTYFRFEYFRRTSEGVEHTLFSHTSADINSLIPQYNVTSIIQSSFNINLTDRLGIRVYGATDSNAARTLSYIVGDGYASYFNVPIALRHTQLRALNSDTNYLHITLAEKNSFLTKTTSGSLRRVYGVNSSNSQELTEIENTPTTSSIKLVTSDGIKTALDLKVDKVAGKALSTNDLTNTLKSNYDTAYTNTHTHSNKTLLDTYTQTEVDLADAVSKKHTHSNKTILDNTTASYTTDEQTKLSGIAIGAEVNVQSDWNATSGDALILNKPTTISGYGITDAYTKTEVNTALSGKVDKTSIKNEFDSSTTAVYSSKYVEDNFAQMLYTTPYYANKTGTTTANLTSTVPTLNASNYLTSTTTNTSFNWTTPNFVFTNTLTGNLSLQPSSLIYLSLPFSISLASQTVNFGYRVKMNGVVISSNQTFGAVAYTGGSGHTNVHRAYLQCTTDSLTEKTNYGAGDAITFEVFTQQATSTNMTTRAYCGATINSVDYYTFNELAQFKSQLGTATPITAGTVYGQTSNINTNTFYGYNAGINNTIGYNNIFNGYEAGKNNISGYGNIFVGAKAGINNTTGSSNIFNGYLVGINNTTGNDNIFIGNQTGHNNISGYRNIFNGYASGYNNTSGVLNIFTGSGSGFSNTTGSNNIFIGTSSGYNSTGFNAIAIGIEAGYNNHGEDNIFIGRGSGYNNIDGYNNTFTGLYSGYSNNDGFNNTFNGVGAGGYNTSGVHNTNIGYRSGSENLVGHENVFFGANAGTYISGGMYAGGNTNPNNSVYLGANTKSLTYNDNNEIVIGYDTTGHGSNTATIGNSSITDNYFTGNINATGDVLLPIGKTFKINNIDVIADKVLTSSIVNDLTTGGTTVPLSAEQGKTLNTNKLDKTTSGSLRRVYGVNSSNSQELTEIENTPTTSSTKLVTSGGIKTALDLKLNKTTSGSVRRVYGVNASNAQELIEIEALPVNASTKLVDSNGIYDALSIKANVDASNLTSGNVTSWQDKLKTKLYLHTINDSINIAVNVINKSSSPFTTATLASFLYNRGNISSQTVYSCSGLRSTGTSWLSVTGIYSSNGTTLTKYSSTGGNTTSETVSSINDIVSEIT